MVKYSYIIIRWGELFLKGKNRHLFENALVKDCIDSIYHDIGIKDLDKVKVRESFTKTRNKLYFAPYELSSMESIENIFGSSDAFLKKNLDILKNVYGISSISPVIECETDEDSIKKAIDALLEGRDFDSFRVTCRRSTKNFRMNSNDANFYFGDYVFEKYNKKVMLKGAELNIMIEIDDKSYISVEKIECENGLPLGVSGKVNLLIFEEDLDLLYENSIENLAENTLRSVKNLSKRGCQSYILVDKNDRSDIIKDEIMKKLTKSYMTSKVKIYIMDTLDSKNNYNNIALCYDIDNIIEKKGHYFEIKDKIKSNLTLFPLI